MWFILLIIIVVIIYVVLKHNNSEKNVTIANNTVPAEVPGIMAFLHGFYSLCNRHQVVSTDVLISWKQVDGNSEIKAYTKIFKIDGQYASDCVNNLRTSISQAKSNIESSNKGVNSVDLYQLKRSVADKMILDFFGTDLLQGSFWDIDDCAYVEGKYLEFKAQGIVYAAFNQSQEKTLDSICTKTVETYPNAHICRQANDTIIISFSE